MAVDESLCVSRAKIIKKVETYKSVAILTPDPALSFGLFAKQFVEVRAAGGVVVDAAERVLMIALRGRWDLPKGHIEQGEKSRDAALREVVEETGIVAECMDQEPLCTTFHAYDTYGRWELKQTDWWAMRATAGEPTPQREEGITEVVWCDAEQLAEAMKNTYRTIKEVVEALNSRQRGVVDPEVEC